MRNFWNKMFGGGLEKKREVGVVTSTSSSSSSTADQTMRQATWRSNIVSPGGKQSLLIPAWCRGVSLIMQTMGQMVVQYQRKNREGGNFVEESWGRNGKLNYLLQVRPNPLMSASEMQEQIEFRKIYFGNAYVYIDRDEIGDVKALWLCNGGGYNLMDDTYTITYNDVGGIRNLVGVPSRDVLHFKNVFLTDDMTAGIPMIWVARQALSITATANEQALSDLAKGGRFKVIVQEKGADPVGTRGRANQDQLKKITQQMGEDLGASDAIFLSNVVDTKMISQTSQQLQLLESRGFSVAEIARILGIPRIMMMEDSGTVYTAPEHATQEFLLRTIQPRIRKHEDELNSKLLYPEDFGKKRIHVCELPLRRLDAKGQAEIDRIHLETGWSVNQVLGQYDLPSIPDGDAHYLSTNLAEVGSEKLRSNGGGRPAETNGGNVAEEGGEA